MSRPSLPRVKFAWPAFALPSPRPALGRWTAPARERWSGAFRREQASGETADFTRFAAVLGVFSLVAIAALIAVLIGSLVSGDDDDSVVGHLESPSPTAAPESPTETPEPTDEPEPSETPESTTPGAPVPPKPRDGGVSLAFWANELSAWWFGDLPEGASVYHEADEVPFLARWPAEPGHDYLVEISYDCVVDGEPAIDLLTGVEYAHDDIFLAEFGPGGTFPDAAVPIPDTPDLGIDDAAPGLLYIYGGTFSLLPNGPAPAGNCMGQRSITMPVTASGDEMILMGSAWLAAAEDHGGQGAGDVESTITLRVSVEGAGSAEIGIEPDVIAP